MGKCVKKCAMSHVVQFPSRREVEESEGVVKNGGFDVCHGEFIGLREFADDEGDVGRFVAGAAMRGGGEIGRIGFDHEAGERYDGAERGGKFCAFEGHDPADAKEEVWKAGQQFLCLLGGAAEAVEHATQDVGIPAMTGDDVKECFNQFSVCGAGVNDQRQVVGDCPPGLSFEGLRLFLSPTFVPIEVDAHLSNCHEFFGCFAEHLFHPVEQRRWVFRQFGGMKSHHGEAETGIVFRHLHHGLQAGFVNVGEQQGTCSCFSRTLHYFCAVCVKFFCVDVSVGVDEHGRMDGKKGGKGKDSEVAEGQKGRHGREA